MFTGAFGSTPLERKFGMVCDAPVLTTAPFVPLYNPRSNEPSVVEVLATLVRVQTAAIATLVAAPSAANSKNPPVELPG